MHAPAAAPQYVSGPDTACCDSDTAFPVIAAAAAAAAVGTVVIAANSAGNLVVGYNHRCTRC